MNAKQEIAIQELARGKKKTEAAKAAGVTRQTLWSWLQTAEFADALSIARRELIDELAHKYQSAEDEAFAVLRQIMADEKANPRDRIKAAIEIRKEAHRLRELGEIEERLLGLEVFAATYKYEQEHGIDNRPNARRTEKLPANSMPRHS